MNKTIFLIGLMFLVAARVNANAIFENSLAGFGHTGFEATEEKCKEYLISLPEPEGFAFLSINAELFPTNKGAGGIKSYFNGELLEFTRGEELICSKNERGGFECKAHHRIEKNLVEKENSIKICLMPSESIVRIMLHSRTTIGYYEMGEFKTENFSKCIEVGGECLKKHQAVVGEDLIIRINAFNSGNANSKITVEAMRGIAGELRPGDALGQNVFSGVVESNSTESFYYRVRVREKEPFIIPPSALYYKDAFGREYAVFSNIIDVNPKKTPEIKAVAALKTTGLDNKVIVSLANDSGIDIRELDVRLEGLNFEDLTGKKTILLGKQSIERLEFEVEIQPDSEISCIAFAKDFNAEYKCNNIRIPEQRHDWPVLLIAGLVLVAISFGVLHYLNSLPE